MNIIINICTYVDQYTTFTTFINCSEYVFTLQFPRELSVFSYIQNFTIIQSLVIGILDCLINLTIVGIFVEKFRRKIKGMMIWVKTNVQVKTEHFIQRASVCESHKGSYIHSDEMQLSSTLDSVGSDAKANKILDMDLFTIVNWKYLC